MEAFGSILASKSRSKFGNDFGMLFCRIPERDGTLTDRWRVVGGSSTRLQRRSRCGGSPWAAPLSRAEGSYKRLGSQAPRPKASQASQTRSNTPWARGPANFKTFPCRTFAYSWTFPGRQQLDFSIFLVRFEKALGIPKTTTANTHCAKSTNSETSTRLSGC